MEHDEAKYLTNLSLPGARLLLMAVSKVPAAAAKGERLTRFATPGTSKLEIFEKDWKD